MASGEGNVPGTRTSGDEGQLTLAASREGLVGKAKQLPGTSCQLCFCGSSGQVAKSLAFSKEARNLNFCVKYPFKS